MVWKLSKISRIPSERVNSDFRRGVSESVISSKQHEIKNSKHGMCFQRTWVYASTRPTVSGQASPWLVKNNSLNQNVVLWFLLHFLVLTAWDLMYHSSLKTWHTCEHVLRLRHRSMAYPRCDLQEKDSQSRIFGMQFHWLFICFIAFLLMHLKVWFEN